METRAHYVFIGSLVVILIAAALLFVIWIGQTQREFDEYDVVFRDRVSGLTEGAQVSFNGIQKGEVRRLTIDPDDPSVVVARVQVGRDTPIKTDTRAELELVGFTGLAIIQFVGGSPQQPLLKETVKGVPKIEAEAGGIAQIFEGGNDIITAANRLLSDKNIEAINNIVGNIDIVIAAVADNDEDIAKTVQNLAAMTEDLAAMTDQLEALTVQAQSLLGEEAPNTLAETQAAVKEARLLIKDLRGVVDENRDGIAVFTNQGLAQAGPAMAEARRMFKTLDQVLKAMDRNPRAYLLGEATPEVENER